MASNDNKGFPLDSVRPNSAIDWAITALLVGLIVAHGLKFVVPGIPFEDAAMFMRLAKNIADGHGFVWNVGDVPADGTDFLSILLISGVVKLGLPVDRAMFLTAYGAHALTALLIYWGCRRVHGASIIGALLAALYLIVGPGTRYVEGYFATPIFALAALVAFMIATRIAWQDNVSRGWSVSFAFAALFAGLLRPDGVFLVIFILLAIVAVRGLKQSRIVIFDFVVVMGVLGGAYFAWRWSLFGYPLPTPFYVKSTNTGDLALSNGLAAAEWVARHSLVLIPIYLVGLVRPNLHRYMLFALFPVFGFTAMWVLVTDPLNYMGRLQYAALPLLLFAWPPIWRGAWEQFNLPRLRALSSRARIVLVGGICAAALIGLVLVHQISNFHHGPDGRYDVALALSKFKDKDYTMAVTESGLLPFYSEWRAIDIWGFTDPWIAHNGRITEEYLDRYKPELVMMVVPFTPLTEAETLAHINTETAGMGEYITREYALERGYILAAAFGKNAHLSHYYYVRRDFPDSAEIVQLIRNRDYPWWDWTSVMATDYARVMWKDDPVNENQAE